MNAKTFLITTEEGISWAELVPDENWDVGVPRLLAWQIRLTYLEHGWYGFFP